MSSSDPGYKQRDDVIYPDESVTFDTGDGRTFTYTASASANAAISSLRSLPESPQRDLMISAQSIIGNMSAVEVRQEIALLAAPDAKPDSKFGPLDRDTLRTALELEHAARSGKLNLWQQAGLVVFGGVVTFVITNVPWPF